MNGSPADRKTRVIRWLMVVAGIAFAIGGLLTLVLPVPVGLPLLAFSLFILTRHSRVARYVVTKAARHNPWLRRLLRRLRLLTPRTNQLQTASAKTGR